MTLRRALGWVLVLAVLGSGCRDVLGVDEFEISERLEPCEPLYVRSGSSCVPVGVGTCGEGFESENGGCKPVVPEEEECPPAHYARPGLASCSPLTTLCPDTQFGEPTDPIGTRVYVGREGTVEPRYNTIQEALDDTVGDLTILLSRGTHEANVEIRNRRVRLIGVCSDATTLQGKTSAPVIRLGPGADASNFLQLAITGSGPGLLVSGAARVEISAVWFHDLGGPGVIFDDFEGWHPDVALSLESSGSIERSLIKRATDVGVGAYGAKLTLRDVQISDTRPRGENLRAHGLVVRPSPRFELRDGKQVEDVRHRSEVMLSRSLIERSAGAAVLVEGSQLLADAVLIRDVSSDLARHGRGIDVRAHIPGRLPARVEIRQSVIENTYDVGLSAWNADYVLVENSVIRDIGKAMETRCLGNGIRARYDLVRDLGLGVRLEVKHSLIDRARQSGLHVEGGSASIEDSLIRDTAREPCRSDFGDGIAIHASATGASLTSISRTKIENAARSGIASFDSATTLDTVGVQCSGAGVAVRGGNVEMNSAFCGCSRGLAPCALETSPGSSLFGGAGCRPNDGTVCYRGCSGTVGQPSSVLSNATIWAYDHDEIASVLSSGNGCYELEGLVPNKPSILSIMHHAHVAGMGMATPLGEDSRIQYRADLLEPSLLSIGQRLLGQPDFRNVYVLLLRVCKKPKTVTNQGICVGQPGLTLTLEPGPSRRIYFNEANLPDLFAQATLGSDAAFVNVAPGEHVITISDAAGQKVECELEEGGLGWSAAARNQVRVLAEEGFTMIGAEVTCAIVAH